MPWTSGSRPRANTWGRFLKWHVVLIKRSERRHSTVTKSGPAYGLRFFGAKPAGMREGFPLAGGSLFVPEQLRPKLPKIVMKAHSERGEAPFQSHPCQGQPIHPYIGNQFHERMNLIWREVPAILVEPFKRSIQQSHIAESSRTRYSTAHFLFRARRDAVLR